MSGNCLIAMYHYVRDARQTRFPGLNALTPSDFAAQLDAIANARECIQYAQFERAVANRQPFDKPTALLTFDDGFVDHYATVLPALVARGMSGVFFLAGAALSARPRVLNVHKTHFLVETLGAAAFAEAVQRMLNERPVLAGVTLSKTADVYRYDASAPDAEVKHLLNYELPYETVDTVLSDLFTEHIGEESAFARALYLSAEQIRDMSAAGMTFGFHTEQHRVLSRLPVEEQQREVQHGVARIQALTEQSTVPFCYPYGHLHTYTAATIATVRESGYTMAFTTTRRAADLALDDAFELPRYDTRDLPPFTSVVPNA